MRRIPFPWTTLYANTGSGSKKFIPITGWLPAAEAAKARVDFYMANASANFQCAWGYQVADVDSETPTAVEKGNPTSSDGKKVGALLSINADTDGKAMIRFGFVVWSSDASLVFATVMGEVTYGRV